MKPTKAELAAGLTVIRIVADTIRELGKVPSGTLYVNLIGVSASGLAQMNLEQYNRIIAILKDSGLVREENHQLIWIEPAPGKD